MKIYIPILLFFTLILSSCSSPTYYLSSLSSIDERVELNDKGIFLAKHDDIWITYSFSANRGTLQVSVYNTSLHPISVDWEESELVIADRKYSYAKSRLSKEGVSAIRPQLFDSKGEALAEAVKSTRTRSYVPPKTIIKLSAFPLEDVNFQVLSKSGSRKYKMQVDDKKNINAKRINYSYEESPLKFTSNIAIQMGDDNLTNYNQYFYLENITYSKSLNPKTASPFLASNGNVIYMKKASNSKLPSILKQSARVATIAGLVLIGIGLNNTDVMNIDSDDISTIASFINIE